MYYYTSGERPTRRDLLDRFDAAYNRGTAAAEVLLSRLRNVRAIRSADNKKPGETTK